MKEKKESFEDLLKKLEEITGKLESEEEISLEESMKLFEEGMVISQKCNQEIEQAEKKISILIREKDEIKEENFIQSDAQDEE